MTGSDSLEILKKDVMQEIYQNKMLLTSKRDRPKGWTLISGFWSPFYIQLRILSSFPETLRKTAKAMTLMLNEEASHINKIVGVAFAGVPIATAISIESAIPACHTRKFLGVRTEDALKRALAEYGQHSLLEGVVEEGDVLCIVDDLVTGLESKLMARAQILAELERQGIRDVRCDDIAVIIDRQQGAKSKAAAAGLQLHSLIKFVDEGLPMIKELMAPEEYDLIMDYLENPEKYQK